MQLHVTQAPGTSGSLPDEDNSSSPRVGARLTIDLDAVAANYRLLREAAGTTVAGVVKADGYGLGAVQIAARLVQEGCRSFFVAHLAEALALRHARIPGLEACPIAILNGVEAPDLHLCRREGLRPVLNTRDDVTEWQALGLEAPEALLQLNTGMNRLGLDQASFEALLPSLRGETPGLPVPVAVMSHLACADDPDHPMNQQQMDRFRDALARLPGIKASLANSAATLGLPATRLDFVRTGIGLYGGNPFAGRPNPLHQVLRLEARILQVVDLKAGESVGYGADYVADRPRRIATVCTGYADGYLRSIGNKGHAELAGHRVPVVGRVSMDMLALDVTAVPPSAAVRGNQVTLIGGSVTIDALAAEAGTASYEILTSLGSRYARHYVHGREGLGA